MEMKVVARRVSVPASAAADSKVNSELYAFRTLVADTRGADVDLVMYGTQYSAAAVASAIAPKWAAFVLLRTEVIRPGDVSTTMCPAGL